MYPLKLTSKTVDPLFEPCTRVNLTDSLPRENFFVEIVEMKLTNDSEVWNFVRCLEKQRRFVPHFSNSIRENHYSDWGDDFGKVNGLPEVERCIRNFGCQRSIRGTVRSAENTWPSACAANEICGDPANPMEFEGTAARLLSGADLDNPQKVAQFRLGARYPISAAFAPEFGGFSSPIEHRQQCISTFWFTYFENWRKFREVRMSTRTIWSGLTEIFRPPYFAWRITCFGSMDPKTDGISLVVV